MTSPECYWKFLIDFLCPKLILVPITSLQLVSSLDNDLDTRNVKNIVRRDNNGSNKIIVNEISNEIVNLDENLPAWSLIDNWENYRSPTNNEITATIQFSRGCNHKCIFCGQWMFWKKWHCRSSESFTEEVEYLNRKYGVTFFFWADENPAQDQAKWKELLSSLKNANKKNHNMLHHMLNIRVDHIIRDEKYLKLYKEAGIISIDLGMESALQQRLDYFDKETTTELNREALALLRQHDIISIVQVLVGLPDETQETLKKTGGMFKEWNPDLMHFYFTTPFPWTEFGKTMKDFIIESDISKWDYRNPVLKMKNLPMEDLVKICKWLKHEFRLL